MLAISPIRKTRARWVFWAQGADPLGEAEVAGWGARSQPSPAGERASKPTPTPLRGQDITEVRVTPIGASPHGPTPLAAIRHRGRQTDISRDTRGSVSGRAAGANAGMGTYLDWLLATDARVVHTRSIGRGSPFACAPLFPDMEMHPAILPATNAPV